MKSTGRLFPFLFSLLSFLATQAEAGNIHVIVCGSGGEPEYTNRFADWGNRLQKVLIEKLGHSASQVFLLTESGKSAPSSVENIQKIFLHVAAQATSRDVLFVYLIGHGSFRQQVAKLNVPGKDLTAEDLTLMLKPVQSERVVIINSASASAPFINALSGKGRIVCTSTRSAEEKNATQFMASFVQALEEGHADQNRDERISVLEACQQASLLTQVWYDEAGWISTEHALIDDNGDGLGTRVSELQKTETDGVLASQCFLMDFQLPEGVSPETVSAYRHALDEVHMLIAKKTAMDSVAYYHALEQKLVHAARLNRQIRGGK